MLLKNSYVYFKWLVRRENNNSFGAVQYQTGSKNYRLVVAFSVHRRWHYFETKCLPEITRRITNSKSNKCPNAAKTLKNLTSLKDFLTKYWKVKSVYTIDANQGDQNPLGITLGRWASFPNVLRTFAPKSSHVQIFLKLWLQVENDKIRLKT